MAISTQETALNAPYGIVEAKQTPYWLPEAGEDAIVAFRIIPEGTSTKFGTRLYIAPEEKIAGFKMAKRKSQKKGSKKEQDVAGSIAQNSPNPRVEEDVAGPEAQGADDPKGKGPADTPVAAGDLPGGGSAAAPVSDSDRPTWRLTAKQKGKGRADATPDPEEHPEEGSPTEPFSDPDDPNTHEPTKQDISKAKKEVKKLRDQFKKQHANVISLVSRHHEKLRDIWMGMNKKQREKILKGAYKSSNPGSGVDMPTELNPDVEIILDHQDAGRHGRAARYERNKHWYWFLIPQINLPGLVQDRCFLLLLFERARLPAFHFSEGDLSRSDAGRGTGDVVKELPDFELQGVIIRQMEQRTWYEFYGRFLDQSTMTQNELDDFGLEDPNDLWGVLEDPEFACWILDAQSFIYRFLFNSCKAILDSAKFPKAELKADSFGPKDWHMKVDKPDEIPCGEEMAKKDRLLLERPYMMPKTIDFHYVEETIKEALAPWQQHVDRLKLDPGYFAKCMALADLTNNWRIRGDAPDFIEDPAGEDQFKSDLAVWSHINNALIKGDFYARIMKLFERLNDLNQKYTDEFDVAKQLERALNGLLDDGIPIRNIDNTMRTYYTVSFPEQAERVTHWRSYMRRPEAERKKIAENYFDQVKEATDNLYNRHWGMMTRELTFVEEVLQAAYWYQSQEFSWLLCEPQLRIFFRKVTPPDGDGGEVKVIQKKGEWASDVLDEPTRNACLEIIELIEELANPPPPGEVAPVLMLGMVQRLGRAVEKFQSEGTFFPTPWFISAIRDAEAILSCHRMIRTLEPYSRFNADYRHEWKGFIQSERSDLTGFHRILLKELMWHMLPNRPYIKRATNIARLLSGAESGFSLPNSGDPDTAEMKASRQHYNDLLDHFWYCVHQEVTGASPADWAPVASFEYQFGPMDDTQVQFARDHARPERGIKRKDVSIGSWLADHLPERVTRSGQEEIDDYIKYCKETFAVKNLVWNNDIVRERRTMGAIEELEIWREMTVSIEKCKHFTEIEKSLDDQFLAELRAEKDEEIDELERFVAEHRAERDQREAAGAGDEDEGAAPAQAHPDILTHDLEYSPEKRPLPEPPKPQKLSPVKPSLSKRSRDEESPTRFIIPRGEAMIEALGGRKAGRARARERKAAEAAAEQAAQAAAAPAEAQAPDHPPKRKFEVRKLEYDVFRLLLSDEVPRSQAPTLGWDEIVTAMKRMGCKVEHGHGSAVTFTWQRLDHENDMDPRIPRFGGYEKYRPGRPREWHAPHGKKENSVRYLNYRRFGRALMEQFDWTWDRFVLVRGGRRQGADGEEEADDDEAGPARRPAQQEEEPAPEVFVPPPIVPIEDEGGEGGLQLEEGDLEIPDNVPPRRRAAGGAGAGGAGPA